MSDYSPLPGENYDDLTGEPLGEIAELERRISRLSYDLAKTRKALLQRDAQIAIVATKLEKAKELLRRAVKYAREDRMRTPGKTRLSRCLAQAEKFLEEP